MTLEFLILAGAVVGASISLGSLLMALQQKRHFPLANSRDVGYQSSEVLLENANRDVRDLQEQLRELHRVIRESKTLQK
jgi:hypothetical protein